MKRALTEFILGKVDAGDIPGAVLHVSYKGKVLFQEAMGNQAVYPEVEPASLDTLYDLASLTKMVATAPAILKLVDAGQLKLKDFASALVPEFSGRDKQAITIQHLLTHSSGLPAHRPYHLKLMGEQQVIEQIGLEELGFPVGQQVVYSDLNFILLHRIIEKVTAMKFKDFVSQEIFTPLEMINTAFNPTLPKERFASTEYSEKHGTYKKGIVHDENAEMLGGISGHAGLFSTISDLQNFASMIENNGVFNGRRILSEEAVLLARTNFSPDGADPRGLGWMLNSPGTSSCGDFFSISSYGHTGFTGTSLWFDPVKGLHVILLTNSVHFGRHPQRIFAFRKDVHNFVYTELNRMENS